MKETHIATLQGPRSSWYFGCDVHGEERRERLTTFSGCDIVIASDSVRLSAARGVHGVSAVVVRSLPPAAVRRVENSTRDTMFAVFFET